MSSKRTKMKTHKKEDLYLIWEYYHKLQLTKESAIKCVCRFCNRVYMCHKKRLINHLVRSCKKCPPHIKTYMQTIGNKTGVTNKDVTKRKDDNKDDNHVEEHSAFVKFLPVEYESKLTKCFVYGCNRSRDEFAFFPAPIEVRERDLWNNIITHPFQQRSLRTTDFICERHFAPSDVIRYLVVNGVRIPNKNPVLRRGCLPIKFFDDYVLKSYNRHITKLITISGLGKKRKIPDDENEHEEIPKNTNKESTTDPQLIEEVAPNPEFEILFEESCKDFEIANEITDIQHEEIIVKTEPDDDITLRTPSEIDFSNIDVPYNIDTLIKTEMCDMDISNLKDEINYDSDSSEDVENNFFERIFETRSFPGLSDYWAICPCKTYVKPLLQNLVDDNKSVVFTQMKVRNRIPVTDKQILLTEDLKLHYFVGHNQVMEIDLPCEIFSTTELAAAINQYAVLTSCEGGPNIDDKEFDFISNSSTYYKDYSNQSWRHKLCTFFSPSGSVCIHCKYVKKYFKQKQKLKTYSAKRNKTNNVIIEECNDNSETVAYEEEDLEKK